MILLDTQAAIWLALAPERLTTAAAVAIEDATRQQEAPGISVMSLYEIESALRHGRIQSVLPRRTFLDQLRSRLRVYPVTEAIAICAAELAEPFSGDVLDRIVVATAILENCTLLTADQGLRGSGVCKILW